MRAIGFPKAALAAESRIEMDPNLDDVKSSHAYKVAREIVRRARAECQCATPPDIVVAEKDFTSNTVSVAVTVELNGKDQLVSLIVEQVFGRRACRRDASPMAMREVMNFDRYGSSKRGVYLELAEKWLPVEVFEVFNADIVKHTVKHQRGRGRDKETIHVFGVPATRKERVFIEQAVATIRFIAERAEVIERMRLVSTRMLEESVNRVIDLVGKPGPLELDRNSCRTHGSSGAHRSVTYQLDKCLGGEIEIDVFFNEIGTVRGVRMTIGTETPGAQYAARLVRTMLAAIEVGYHQKEVQR